MWWHGGAGPTKLSERGSLSVVATHDVFAAFRSLVASDDVVMEEVKLPD